MLNGTTDAAGNVELGRHNFSGLAHLPVVRGIARIYCSSAGANGSTQLICQGRHDFIELFTRTQSPSARHNDFGCSQFGAVVFGHFRAHKLALPTILHSLDAFHRGRSASCGRRIKARGAHRQHLDGI